MSVRGALFALTAALNTVGAEANAQSLSPFSEFQGLTSGELVTVQGKLTDVGGHGDRTFSSLGFAGSGQAFDVTVFAPFHRAGFESSYGGDYRPHSFAVSTAETAALIDSIAALPTVTDGGVNGHLSFALSVIKDGATKVFESLIDTTGGRLLFGEMLAALAGNGAATQAVTEYACMFGLLPGPLANDVTGQVAIRVRGFRRDRATGHYVGKVRVTNMSGQGIDAPLIFVFRPAEGITSELASGFTCALRPRGAPYFELPTGSTLGPGQHVEIALRFSNPDGDTIELLNPRVFAGPGFR